MRTIRYNYSCYTWFNNFRYIVQFSVVHFVQIKGETDESSLVKRILTHCRNEIDLMKYRIIESGN